MLETQMPFEVVELCERGLEVSPVRGWQALNAGGDEKTGPREARRVAFGRGSLRLDPDGMLAATKTFNEQIREGNLNPFDRSEIVICSYQFARSKEPYVPAAATSAPFPAPECPESSRDSLF